MANPHKFQHAAKTTSHRHSASGMQLFTGRQIDSVCAQPTLTHASQNNLMELWSLLHFLMPYIFRSRKEFSFWFSNPMNNVIEGTANQNEEMIARLHGIIRPFVLRRLKKDVETQLPGKFEHIIKCPLSRRQVRYVHLIASTPQKERRLTFSLTRCSSTRNSCLGPLLVKR